MPNYTTLSLVRERLKISDTADDTALNNFITQAEAIIDNVLKARGFTVPVSPAPQILIDAASTQRLDSQSED